VKQTPERDGGGAGTQKYTKCTQYDLAHIVYPGPGDRRPATGDRD